MDLIEEQKENKDNTLQLAIYSSATVICGTYNASFILEGINI